MRRAVDVLSDARAVEARRRRGGAVEARGETGSEAYPIYYRQNFHYQSGGWFTEESARRYEAQVEVLFSGAAGAMRRRALSLLAKAWRERDQRGLSIVDVACGVGQLSLSDLRRPPSRGPASPDWTCPTPMRTRPLESTARRPCRPQPSACRSPTPALTGLSCIYLFHELPPKVRTAGRAGVRARAQARRGLLAFADSIQGRDAPDLERLLQVFPAFFHEPYYESYQSTDLPALFGAAQPGAGWALTSAFLTKALVVQKAGHF